MSWAARFAALADRKAAEARDAELWPFRSDAVLDLSGLLPVGNDWSRHLFDGSFYLSPPPSVELPAVSLVVVQSRDGNTGASDPSALGGGATDKHLVYEGLSRVAADAVIAGADTIRGSDIVFSVWREEMVRLRDDLGKPRHPVQIVATLRGLAVDETLLFNLPELRVVVVTIASGFEAMRTGLAERPWITPVVMAHSTDLMSACRALRRMGIERVSAVGGRTFATAMLDAGVVQDLYLTMSPKSGGDPNTPLYPRPLERQLIVSKHGTGPDAGVVFEHTRVVLVR